MIILGIFLTALVFLSAFLWRRHRILQKFHVAMMDEFAKLIDRYETVQFGYDQGVLEGMRQAYVNVRATLADEMFVTGGTDGMKIRAFITPLLSDLGSHETRLLDEMEGLTKQRYEFEHGPVKAIHFVKQLPKLPHTAESEEK